MYAAGYAGDFSTALKLFRNSKKDDVTHIEFGNMVLLAILLFHLFTGGSRIRCGRESGRRGGCRG